MSSDDKHVTSQPHKQPLTLLLKQRKAPTDIDLNDHEMAQSYINRLQQFSSDLLGVIAAYNSAHNLLGVANPSPSSTIFHAHCIKKLMNVLNQPQYLDLHGSSKSHMEFLEMMQKEADALEAKQKQLEAQTTKEIKYAINLAKIL